MRQCILLIDDTPSILRILNDILKDSYDIIIAKTGQEGVAIAKEQKPDLIVLDVLMPNMSGIEVFNHLKDNKETANIPVVFITGQTADDDEAEGYAMGVLDYIKKPFARDVVKYRIDYNIRYILMERLLKQHNLEI